MADSARERTRPSDAGEIALAPWRKILTLLAGACLAFGVVWLVVLFAGPIGPLTVNAVAAVLVLLVLVWVMLNAVVQGMAKRSRPRDPW